jgi:hypothetical protein
MVPFWQLATSKRTAFKNSFASSSPGIKRKVNRARDLLRFRYPLKLDFCRMTLDELTSAMGQFIKEDAADPRTFRPVVTIGHTKDLFDFETIEGFLTYLESNGVRVSTFVDVYPKLARAELEQTA